MADLLEIVSNIRKEISDLMDYDSHHRIIRKADGANLNMDDVAFGVSESYAYGAMYVINQLYDRLAEQCNLMALDIIENLKRGWADRIKHITFTGVDQWTDIRKLKSISVVFPKVEFGVLMSQNWNEDTPRFCPPDFLVNLEGLGLNLSLHLCGELARQAIRNNFQPAIEMCQGYFGIFKRCQLNIASYDTNPETLELDVPDSLDEVIIQQKGVSGMKLFSTAYPNPKISVLLDASGGRGIEGAFNVPKDYKEAKIGYAGGLNADNVVRKLETLILRDVTHDFWIDMESSVRTDDRFDIQKVIDILKLIRPLI